MSKQSKTLLSAVVATGAGTAVEVQDERYFTFYIEPTGTVDMTVKIQSLAPSGNWVAIDSRTLTTATSFVVQVVGRFTQIRANVTTWVNGTLTVGMESASS